MAISPYRVLSRASSRLATLAHAISSTNPTAPTIVQANRPLPLPTIVSRRFNRATPASLLVSGVRRGEPRCDGVHLRLRVRHRHSWFQARDGLVIVLLAGLKLGRGHVLATEDVGNRRVQEAEPGRQHSHYGARTGSEHEAAAENGRIPAEPALPIFMAQEDTLLPFRAIASQGGLHPQDAQQVGTGAHAVERLGWPVPPPWCSPSARGRRWRYSRTRNCFAPSPSHSLPRAPSAPLGRHVSRFRGAAPAARRPGNGPDCRSTRPSG